MNIDSIYDYFSQQGVVKTELVEIVHEKLIKPMLVKLCTLNQQPTYLERVVIQCTPNTWSGKTFYSFHLERRNSWSQFKQVRMVAHLAQLHKNIDDTEQIAGGQCLFGPETSSLLH